MDDGRAVAVADWDADGDLDLWLKNRSGPTLRYLRNDAGATGHWLALRLEGTTSNRDAVGAVVEVVAGGSRRRRDVSSGDGYLSQSSRWLHFGLGAVEAVDRIEIRWPGGETEAIPPPAVDGRYLVRQGSGRAARLEPRRTTVASVPLSPTDPPRLTRVLLKEPLHMPPSLREILFGDRVAGRAKLLLPWAHWCAPCLEELSGLAAGYPDVKAAGIDIVALNLDAPEDRERAEQVFRERVLADRRSSAFRTSAATEDLADLLDAVLEHVLLRPGEVALPTSMLVDSRGELQMIYLGPVTPERLVQDAGDWISKPVVGAARTLEPGRWYYRTPRDLLGFAAELKARDLREDARFYVGLAHLRGGGKPGKP